MIINMRKHRIGGNQRVEWKFNKKTIEPYLDDDDFSHTSVWAKCVRKIIYKKPLNKQY
jgi:hypothetical protein